MRRRLAGARIAVIEDDMLLCRSMALFLQAKGSNVETYASAEEAGDAVFRGGFDLVISGYLLPGENGLSFLRRFRGVSRKGWTLLIANRPENDLPKDAHSVGIDGLLMKPFSTKELESALGRIFERREPGSDGIVKGT